jgi:hypothetical protein
MMCILQCRAQSTKEQWAKSTDKLKKWMEKMTTLPQLQATRCNYNKPFQLAQWRTILHSQEGHQWPHVHAAILDQETIGWGIMLEGCLSQQHWKAVQEE